MSYEVIQFHLDTYMYILCGCFGILRRLSYPRKMALPMFDKSISSFLLNLFALKLRGSISNVISCLSGSQDEFQDIYAPIIPDS